MPEFSARERAEIHAFIDGLFDEEPRFEAEAAAAVAHYLDVDSQRVAGDAP